MTGFTYRRGAALAMLCAGPLTVLPIMVLVPLKFGAAEIPGLIFMFAISIPLGVIGAFLPILLGGYAMASWGSRDPRARHPARWGMAGAALAVLIAAVMYGADGDVRFLATITGMFAATGAICALIVRFRTHWDDEVPAAVSNAQGEAR